MYVCVSIVSVRVNVFVALNILQSSLSKLVRVNRKKCIVFYTHVFRRFDSFSM
jgi:hypothetical protein